MRKPLLVFAILVALLFGIPATATPAAQPQPQGARDLSVIMTTYTMQDKNTGKWGGESGPFLNDMDATGKGKDVSDQLPYCDKAIEGNLYGHHVLLITTGTTKIPASQCAMNFVLSPFIKETKEVILTGISGFSPRVGGYLDSVGQAVPSDVTEIGDVCIAPIVVNEVAFQSMKRQTYWHLNWETAADVGTGDMDLAKAIYKSAQNVKFPALPDQPKSNVLKYFPPDKATGNSVLRPPKAWFGNCTELTSDIFWHSALDDQYARDWITGPLNKAFGTTLKPSDVLVSTAMETIGIAAAIQKYNSVNKDKVPFALVRSSSNYDQPWVDASGAEAVGPAQSISEGMDLGGDAFGATTEYMVVKQYLTDNE